MDRGGQWLLRGIPRTWTTTGPTGRIVKRVAHGYRERRVCAE
jgi:hypothetical protein